jgi:hypothetical protein
MPPLVANIEVIADFWYFGGDFSPESALDLQDQISWSYYLAVA